MYEDVYKMKEDVININKMIVEDSKMPQDTKVLDERIYNKNRLFRMLHCRNMGANIQDKDKNGEQNNFGFFALLD